MWLLVLCTLLPFVLAQNQGSRGRSDKQSQQQEQQQANQQQQPEISLRTPREGEKGCPVMAPIPGVCTDTCKNDDECAFGKICCATGCGRSCVNRVLRPVPKVQCTESQMCCCDRFTATWTCRMPYFYYLGCLDPSNCDGDCFTGKNPSQEAQ